ncbi:uncharacterized protein LOC131938066 isoform X2 [Physella acuta]|nr:uncharacterized protein LOC131938066 isoform X2 [Physella acuta]
MANTVRKVLKNCAICSASRPAVSTLNTSVFSNIGESDLFLHNNNDMAASEKPDVFQHSAQVMNKQEESPGEMQYIVTAELQEPEEVDSDLDFDPNCAVVDAVFNPRSDFDVARKFWQKVEIQLIGPFPYKKKRSVYVIASMDSFSKWPEVNKLEKVNEKTVSQFCLRLIARYGIMEQLLILENEVTKDKCLDVNGIGQNLHYYNIFISKESTCILDECWSRLVNNITRFVKLYTDTWFDCLDLCLIPLRNSLSQNLDFTPTYLLMGREPVFPESIIHGRDSSDAEVALNEEQIKQSIDTAMSHYLQCSIPDIKQFMPLPMGEAMHEAVDRPPLRKSLRRSRKFHRLAGFDGGEEDVSDESDKEADLQSARKQKNIGNSTKNCHSNDSAMTKQETQKNENVDNISEEKDEDKIDDTLDKIDLDTYYSIIYSYKKEDNYPLNSDNIFKRMIRKASENFVLENDVLMYKQKGKLKKVLTKMEDRLAAMKESHVVKGEHMSRAKVQETLEARNIFWKGIFMDARAFVGACPDCKHGEPRKRRRASKKALRWLRGGVEDEEDSDTDPNIAGDIGKVTIQELIDYLRKDVEPDGLTRSELLGFRKKAKNFKLDKGILYYWPNKRLDLKPRKVLKTEKERLEALKKAHGDNHAGKNEMMESLKKSCFWQSMSEDLDQFLSKCCQPESGDEDMDKDPALEQRLKLFQDYFAGKDICPKQESSEQLLNKKDDSKELQKKKDLVAAAMESAMLTVPNSTELCVPAEESPSVLGVSASSDHEGFPASQTPDTSLQNLCQDQISPNDAHTTELKVEQDKESIDMNDEDEDLVDGLEDEDWKPMQEITEKGKSNSLSTPGRKPSIRRRCETCQEVIRGDNNFKEHMYKHTGIKPFSCNQCHKMFTSIKGLNMHTRKHTGHRPYLCNICGRGFPRCASLRYHIKTHDKGGGVPVVCDICSRSFTTENRLLKHKLFKHPAQAPVYMCQQCGKHFTAKRSLKRHEEAHQGIKKYECQYCKRSFFRKEYLNYHLVSHSNEDPTLANYKMKSKLKKSLGMEKKRDFSTGLSIVCLDSTGVPVTQDHEMYSQLVEVTDPQEWTEVQGERTIVYGLEGSQRVEEVDQGTGEETTVAVMDGHPDGMQVQHIIMPGDHHHHHPGSELTLHHQPQVTHQLELDQTQTIGVTIPGGTFTLPSGGQLQTIDSGQDTVQYHVECLPGETLTEADFNAIRMLAQASLGGTHLLQQ